MRILGISSGHDAGAAIIEDGRVLAAVNEERLVREKLYAGPPLLAIPECLRLTRLQPQNIDGIAIANLTTGGGIQREFRAGQLTWKKRLFDLLSYTGLLDKRFVRQLYLKTLTRTRDEKEVFGLLKARSFTAPLRYIEHHFGHAASAYYASPFRLNDKVLVVTTDGSGDGLCAAIFTVSQRGALERRHETSFFHSPASSFYSNITYNLGFRPLRHEGKITGLAACGDPEKTIGVFRKYLTVDLDKLEYRSRLGCYGRPAARKLHLKLQGHKREDIAAGLQRRIEEVAAALVQKAARKYACDKVCLAGGLFANVRLNQAVRELPEISDVYIHPHMGDGGLAVGAGLAYWAGAQRDLVQPVKLPHVYLGPSFSDEEIEQALRESKVQYRKSDNVEAEVARLLAEGKVVARFDGKMEYGPRALCNRSILYQATDPTVNDWLNKRLRRSEFMPFAPVVSFEDASQYFKGFESEHSFASEFMTITYDVTDKCKQEAPAIVHVDGTARPQVLRREINPSMHKILEEYKKITGLSIVINTSFNIHEEPIVCTPADAVRAFQMSHLDVLAVGGYLVSD